MVKSYRVAAALLGLSLFLVKIHEYWNWNVYEKAQKTCEEEESNP